MSLIIDTLKRIKSTSVKGSVPPGMVNLAPSSRVRPPYIAMAFLLAVALLGIGAVLYIESITADSYNVKRVAKKPVVENPDMSEADVERRIAEAVAVAVEKSRSEMSEAIQNPTTLNRVRAKVAVRELPVSADKKLTESIENVSESEVAAEQVEVEVAEVKPEIEKVEPVKPVISESDQQAFREKIRYNTSLSIASKAYMSGDYRKAADIYENALHKGDSLAFRNLLMSKVRLGDFASLKELMVKHGGLADEYIVSDVALEIASAGFGKLAIDFIGESFRLPLEKSRLFYTSGLIYEGIKSYELAEKFYKSAIRLKPADAYYTYAYGRMLDVKKRYKEAIVMYDKSAAIGSYKDIRSNASTRASILRDYLAELEEERASESKEKQGRRE